MSIEEIYRGVVDLILHASRSSDPNEFAGLLRSEGKRITEVLLLPGTFSSERSALMKLNMLPVSSDVCGSVHSHTSPKSRPSKADLNFFGKFGEVHIIAASPYNESSWKAFDQRGRERGLEVVKSEGRESELGELRKDPLG